MPSLPAAILERSRSLPSGSILAPKEFLHLGTRAAVDQAFCRLVKGGSLQRVGRGLYVAGSDAPLCAATVAQSIAAMGRSAIAVGGETAAKTLGLVSEVQESQVFLTTGRDKNLTVGQSVVSLRHAPYWMFALGSSIAGDAVRAMAWMGHDQADSSATKLYEHLSDVQWESLSSVRASLPSWMAAAIGRAPLSIGAVAGVRSDR